MSCWGEKRLKPGLMSLICAKAATLNVIAVNVIHIFDRMIYSFQPWLAGCSHGDWYRCECAACVLQANGIDVKSVVGIREDHDLTHVIHRNSDKLVEKSGNLGTACQLNASTSNF